MSKSRIVLCSCSARILVEFPKGEPVPSISACQSCKPINHDGTPNVKAGQ